MLQSQHAPLQRKTIAWVYHLLFEPIALQILATSKNQTLQIKGAEIALYVIGDIFILAFHCYLQFYTFVRLVNENKKTCKS